MRSAELARLEPNARCVVLKGGGGRVWLATDQPITLMTQADRSFVGALLDMMDRYEDSE